ncbi:hypothetical protein V2W45_1441656 [Cenococcum geophilum]
MVFIRFLSSTFSCPESAKPTSVCKPSPPAPTLLVTKPVIMSGTGENRGWRRSGQPQQQRQNQDRSSGTNTPTRDNARQQAMPSLSGNSWAMSDKGKGGSTGGERPRSMQPMPVQGEQHVPVRDFNAAEVKDFLKKRYQEAIADQPSPYHKAEGDSVAKRYSGAWSSKAMSHLMPNGQDFFTQLKKQLQALEQGKNT